MLIQHRDNSGNALPVIMPQTIVPAHLGDALLGEGVSSDFLFPLAFVVGEVLF